MCVQAASWGLGHTPLGPGGLGNTSESPRETVGTLDQCQEGKGRVDWEAKKAPGKGSAEERPKEALLLPLLPELQSPRASEPHMIGVSSPVLSGEPPPSLPSRYKLSFLLLCHCEHGTAAAPAHQESGQGEGLKEEW